MAGEPVPADDLPGSAVPASDMPQGLSPMLESAAKIGRGFLFGGVGGAAAEIGKGVMEGQEKVADWAGGAVTDRTGSPAAGAATKAVASVAGPGALGGLGGMTAKHVLRPASEWLMQGALKPTAQALKNTGAAGTNAERGIDTLLDKGLVIGRGSAEKMESRVDALSSAIENALARSGATVDKHAVASRLQDVINKIEKTDLHPQDRLKLVEKIYDDVLTAQNFGRTIPVAQANQIKQGIYQKLKDKYGELGSDAVESEKALARGLKEDIAARHPEVAKMNKEESDLINALELVKHRMFIAGNRDVGGLAWLTLDPKRFAAFMADRSPLFKSVVARMMHKEAPAIGAGVGSATALEGDKK